MAAKSTLVKSIQDELTCPICLHRFRSPKMLPCLHSFCTDCLQDLVAKSQREDRVCCPECRVEHAVPSKGFLDHRLLARLVEHMTVHEAEKEGEDTKLVCGSGLDSNAAAGWCVDCHCYLCQQCMDMHKRLKVISSHETLTLTEMKEGGLGRVHQKHICSEHVGEEMKLYCKTCQDVICRDCTIVAHKGHEYVFIKDAKEEIVEELQQLTAQVERGNAKFQEWILKVDTAMAMKRKNFSLCEKQVNNYFDVYIKRINSHRASLLNTLHHTEMQDEKKFVTKKEDLEFTKARLTSAIAFTKQLLSSGNMTDIALLSKQASEQLRSLTKLKQQPNIEERVWSFVQEENLMECSVVPTSLCFLDLPFHLIDGLNRIDIYASVKPDVKISSRGRMLFVNSITPIGPSTWRVVFQYTSTNIFSLFRVLNPDNNVCIIAQASGSTISARLSAPK